jgi:hypothetical protein
LEAGKLPTRFGRIAPTAASRAAAQYRKYEHILSEAITVFKFGRDDIEYLTHSWQYA